MESIDTFYDRIYVNLNTYPQEPFVLVWPSKSAKEDRDAKKPETWDLQTCKNYIQFIESGDPMRWKDHGKENVQKYKRKRDKSIGKSNASLSSFGIRSS